MKLSALIGLPFLSLPLLLSSPAAAQEEGAADAPAEEGGGKMKFDSANEEAEPEEQPKMNFNVADPPPSVQRDAYVHNGFYFRFDVGPGYMYNSLSNKALDVSASSSAFAIGADILVGGSPAPGLAFGVGALGNLGLGAKYNGVDPGGMFQVTTGPFFDVFPNPKGSFHVGTLIGMSAMALSKDVSPDSSLFGGGAAGWLGWDVFAAPEWSAGAKLQAGGAYMVGQDVGSAVFTTNLMITILYH